MGIATDRRMLVRMSFPARRGTIAKSKTRTPSEYAEWTCLPRVYPDSLNRAKKKDGIVGTGDRPRSNTPRQHACTFHYLAPTTPKRIGASEGATLSNITDDNVGVDS